MTIWNSLKNMLITTILTTIFILLYSVIQVEAASYPVGFISVNGSLSFSTKNYAPWQICKPNSVYVPQPISTPPPATIIIVEQTPTPIYPYPTQPTYYQNAQQTTYAVPSTYPQQIYESNYLDYAQQVSVNPNSIQAVEQTYADANQVTQQPTYVVETPVVNTNDGMYEVKIEVNNYSADDYFYVQPGGSFTFPSYPPYTATTIGGKAVLQSYSIPGDGTGKMYRPGETITINSDCVFKARFVVNPTKVSPLILDLNQDGIKTIAMQQGVFFDFTADGNLKNTGWISPEDGFLIKDFNKNGKVDNGRELFGDNTYLSNGQIAKDGFEALAELDRNGDNVLNVYEMSRGDLKIWRDANSNRITDPCELISLWKLNVAEISLEHEVTNDVDENGNFHTLQGSYTKSDGSVHNLTDVFFVSE